MGINNQRQTLELANRVDAARSNLVLAVLGQPDVEVATTTLWAVGSQVNVGNPFGFLEGFLGPDGTPLVARRDGCENDLVGEDLGLGLEAGCREPRNLATVFGGAQTASIVSNVRSAWSRGVLTALGSQS